jgi:hypothetical protein
MYAILHINEGNYMTAGEQLIQDLLHPHIEALAQCKITPLYLAKKHKQELNAKETKFQKVKRGPAFEAPETTEGIKGGTQYREIYSTAEEVVIAIDTIAWDVRQRARMDAQKLMNLYPAEKLDVGGTLDITGINIQLVKPGTVKPSGGGHGD